MKKKTAHKKKSIKNSTIAKNKNIINIRINTHQKKRRQRTISKPKETIKEPNKTGEVVFLPARTIYQQAPLQPVQNNNVGELENIRESVRRQEDLFAKYLNTINLAGRGEVLSTESSAPVPAPVSAPEKVKAPKAPAKKPKVSAPKPTVTESNDNLPVDLVGSQTLDEVDTTVDKDKLVATPPKATLDDKLSSMPKIFDTEDESEFEERLARTNERQKQKKKKKKHNLVIMDEEGEENPPPVAERIDSTAGLTLKPVRDFSSELVTKYKTFSGEVASAHSETWMFLDDIDRKYGTNFLKDLKKLNEYGTDRRTLNGISKQYNKGVDFLISRTQK